LLSFNLTSLVEMNSFLAELPLAFAEAAAPIYLRPPLLDPFEGLTGIEVWKEE
jgi:hypothetical protein